MFVARGKEDLLVTRNINPGESVYGEKRISVEGPEATKTEYRVWNPFRSKLAAGILGGLEEIYIKPGAKVLYLGAASGTSVSHVADLVGDTGVVYAVEFSHRSGRDLINMAKKRVNVIPIIEDARHPQKYRMLVGMVDVIFADVAQVSLLRDVLLTVARPITYCCIECSHVPQVGWRRCDLYQSKLYRFDCQPRSGFCSGGPENEIRRN